MKNSGPVTKGGKPLINCFGYHDRTMPPPGAADADPKVTLAFALKLRQQVGQQIHQPLDSLLYFTFRTKVFYNSRVLSSESSKLRHEVRVRKKPHVKQHIEPSR